MDYTQPCLWPPPLVDKQTSYLQIDESYLVASPSKPPGYYAVQNPRPLMTHDVNTWFAMMQGGRERPAEKVEPSPETSAGSTAQLKQQVTRDDAAMTDIISVMATIQRWAKCKTGGISKLCGTSRYKSVHLYILRVNISLIGD